MKKLKNMLLGIVLMVFLEPCAWSQEFNCGDPRTAHPVNIHLKVELKNTDLIFLLGSDPDLIAQMEHAVGRLIAQDLKPNADFVIPWKIVPLPAKSPDKFPIIRLKVTNELNSNGERDNWKMSVEIQGTSNVNKKHSFEETSVLDSVLLATSIQLEKIPDIVAGKFRQVHINQSKLTKMWELFPVTKGFVSKDKITFADPLRANRLNEHQTLVQVTPQCYLDRFPTNNFELRCRNDAGFSVPLGCTPILDAEIALIDAVEKVCLIVEFKDEQRQPVAGSTADLFFNLDSIESTLDSDPSPSGDYEIGDVNGN